MQVCTSHQDKRDSWDASFDNNEAYVSSLVECQIKLVLREAHLRISSELPEPITNMVSITVAGQRKVQAKTNIAVGKLSLVPVSSYVNLSEDNSNSALNLGHMCSVRGKDLCAHIMPHTKVANAKDSKSQDFFAPFWLVQGTNNPDTANMGLLSHIFTAPGQDWHKGDYSIPIMSNTKPLKPGDVLYFLNKSAGPNTPKYPTLEQMGTKRRRT